MRNVGDEHENRPALQRSIGFPMLVLYGMGTMVGAGFFALSGEVAGKAGTQAPLAFGVAGLLALFSALAFAERWRRHSCSTSSHLNAAGGFVRRPRRACLSARVDGVVVARCRLSYRLRAAALPRLS